MLLQLKVQASVPSSKLTDLDLELVLAPSLLGAPPVRLNLKSGHDDDDDDDDDHDDDGVGCLVPRSSPCKAHSESWPWQ